MKISVIFDPDLGPQEVHDLGLLAEQQGIDAIWVSNYPSSRDPFMNLAPLALASKTLRLGPLVITPYELHPYKTAKLIHSLNELCNGRANILIGGPTGVNAAIGMDTKRMVGRVRECVETLKAVSPDAALNYQGDIFQTWNFQPRWATDEPPHIYVGANRTQMLHMAAGVADRIMVGDPTPARFARTLARLEKNLQEHARSRADVAVSALVPWHVKADAAESFSEARSQLALRGMLDEWYLSDILDADEIALVDAHRNDFFKAYKQGTAVIEGVPDSILDKLVNGLTLAGGPGSLAAHVALLQGYAAQGLDEVAFKLHGDAESHRHAIVTIGGHLVPQL